MQFAYCSLGVGGRAYPAMGKSWGLRCTVVGIAPFCQKNAPGLVHRNRGAVT